MALSYTTELHRLTLVNCWFQSRVRMAVTVWTCWPTTSASVQLDSAVATVNKTLTSVRQTLASTALRAMIMSTRMSVAVYLASAGFAVMSMMMIAPPGDTTFTCIGIKYLVTCVNSNNNNNN